MVRQSAEVRALAREISALKQAQRDGSLTPQLGRSSLDDESINTYDSDGNLRARYGLQHDGTYTAAVLDGPVPPVPTVPTVEGGAGELTVAWDGTYEDDQRAPMDFHVVEVWAADDDFSDRSEARLLGHFSNESGGEITVARPVGEWHIALVSKAQSGRRSAVSARAVAVVESVVDQETIDELNEKLDGLPSVTWSEDPPTAADGDGKPDNAVWRQVDASTDAVIGEWTWDATSSVWVSRPIADDAIYSLDVGKLFASQLGVDTAVANEIWAEKIAASKIDAEEINTQSLGADTGFIGVLNSAEIVGAVIKTAASGARVELDSGNGIRIFNTAGELVLSADSDGNLVTGVDQSEKVRIAPTGITLSTTKATPLATWPVGRVSMQFAVGHSRVYSTPAMGNFSLDVYDLDGTKIDEWALGYRPLSIAVSDDRVYVGSVSDNRVYVYNLNGVLQSQWSTPARPNSIAVEGNTVFVATGASKSVELYDLNGTPIRGFTTNKNAHSIDVVPVPGAGARAVFVGSNDATSVDVYTELGALWETIPTQRRAYDLTVPPSQREPGYFEVYTLDYDRKQFDWYMVDLDDFYSVRIGRFYTAGTPSSINIFDNKFYVGTNPEQAVEVHSMPGIEHTTASLDSETGLLTALSADLGGVTRTETLTPRNILPRGRTDNEDYAPTVEIVRPAFTQGMHVFEDTTHRDLELPDPPDGTTAWTGQGSTLTLWLMTGGQWTKLDHTPPHVPRIASGVVTIPSGSSGAASVTVTLPAGYFDRAPEVTATPRNSNYAGYTNTPTAVSVNVGSRRLTGSNVSSHDVQWTAVQT